MKKKNGNNAVKARRKIIKERKRLLKSMKLNKGDVLVSKLNGHIIILTEKPHVGMIAVHGKCPKNTHNGSILWEKLKTYEKTDLTFNFELLNASLLYDLIHKNDNPFIYWYRPEFGEEGIYDPFMGFYDKDKVVNFSKKMLRYYNETI